MNDELDSELLEAEVEFEAAMADIESLLMLGDRIQERGVSRDSVIAMETEYGLQLTSVIPLKGFTVDLSQMGTNIALESIAGQVLSHIKKIVLAGAQLLLKVLKAIQAWIIAQVKDVSNQDHREDVTSEEWDELYMAYHEKYNTAYDDKIDDDLYQSLNYATGVTDFLTAQRNAFDVTSKMIIDVARQLKKAVKTKQVDERTDISHVLGEIRSQFYETYYRDETLMPALYFNEPDKSFTLSGDMELDLQQRSIVVRTIESETLVTEALKKEARSTKVYDPAILLAKSIDGIDFKETQNLIGDFSKEIDKYARELQGALKVIDVRQVSNDQEVWDTLSMLSQQVMDIFTLSLRIYRENLTALMAHSKSAYGVYRHIIEMRLFIHSKLATKNEE